MFGYDYATTVHFLRGIATLPVDEVEKLTGVAKYGIYGTFGTKHELFKKALEQIPESFAAAAAYGDLLTGSLALLAPRGVVVPRGDSLFFFISRDLYFKCTEFCFIQVPVFICIGLLIKIKHTMLVPGLV